MTVAGRDLNACLVVLATLLLGVALVMEYGFDLAPCALCMTQRLWLILAGLSAAIAMLTDVHRRLFAVLGLGAIGIGASFSLRQLWLQHLPAEQAPSCGPGFDYMLDVLPLGEILTAMTVGTGQCSEVLWRFLGISIPGWALVGFILLGAGFTLHFVSRFVHD